MSTVAFSDGSVVAFRDALVRLGVPCDEATGVLDRATLANRKAYNKRYKENPEAEELLEVNVDWNTPPERWWSDFVGTSLPTVYTVAGNFVYNLDGEVSEADAARILAWQSWPGADEPFTMDVEWAMAWVAPHAQKVLGKEWVSWREYREVALEFRGVSVFEGKEYTKQSELDAARAATKEATA